MKKWRLDFRIWHWIHAVVILGLLGTVFLRKTFLSWRANSEILIQKLSDINLEITSEQAKVLAKAIRAPMWEWHIILGYALGILLVWRVQLFFTNSGNLNYQNLKEKTFFKKYNNCTILISINFLYLRTIGRFVGKTTPGRSQSYCRET